MSESDAGRIVIRGGQVVDGTGAEPLPADVAVVGNRIAEVGDVDARPGDNVLDAAGRYVSPGFINMHGHSDISALTCPDAQNRVFDGVTTEFSGQCGHTVFPVLGAMREHIRPETERERLEVDWTDFAGYVARLEAVGSAINHAFMVGHGALRVAAAGLDDRPTTPDEQKAMRDLLREALDQGVFGLSSGLIYPPGCYGNEDELVDLAAVLNLVDPPGLYSSHQRSEGSHIEESVAEFLGVVRRAGVRGQLSHVKVTGTENWGKITWLRDALHGARDEGLDVFGDRYPYTASSTGLSRDLPKWTHAGGRDEFLRRLADRDVRRRIAEEMNVQDPQDYWSRVHIGWSKVPAHEAYFGRSVYDVAVELGRDPLETAMDLLLEADGSISAIYHRMDEGNLRDILRWPFIVIGSDSRCQPDVELAGRGLPHPRGYGTHARVLGRYARETGVLTWGQAVQKMTGAVAEILGLEHRGILAPGYAADVVVFDPETVSDRATFEAPRQLSAGMAHVLVNGEPVLEDGRQTGARPGRVLRRE